MRTSTAIVAVLLLGACLAALAEEPKAAAQTAEPAKSHGEDGKDKHNKHGMDGRDGRPGKDGQDGRAGPPGADGRPGKDGEDGKDGRDGRDAWVTTAWRSDVTRKVNITAGESAKHVVNQIFSTVTCAEGEKAVACSCDTGMSSSHGQGFQPLRQVDYERRDGSWLGHVNYISLVENALSGPKGKDIKDTCTCTGLYVATVRAKHPEQETEEEEGEEVEGEEKPSPKKQEKKKYEEKEPESYEKKYEKKSEKKYEEKEPESYEKKSENKYDEYKYRDAEIASKQPSYYADDWTKKAPKWQAFEITATATCQSVKLVPRPHHKDAYDEEKYEKHDKYEKKGDDKDDDEWKSEGWKGDKKY